MINRNIKVIDIINTASILENFIVLSRILDSVTLCVLKLQLCSYLLGVNSLRGLRLGCDWAHWLRF